MWVNLLDGTMVNLNRVECIRPKCGVYPCRICFPSDASGDNYIEIKHEEYEYLKEQLGFAPVNEAPEENKENQA